MFTFLQDHRRVSTLALLAALALGGCGRTNSTSPITQVASPEMPSPPVAVATAAPPPAASPQLPPPPTPATFDVAALSEQVKPTVVNITITHEVSSRFGEGGPDPFEFFFGPRGGRAQPDRPQKQTALGTGFIIDASGYVVTNEHVVREADEVRVRLADEREFVADVVGRDPKLDLALLKLQGAKDLPVAALGSSEQLRVGEHVLAVGNPFGLGHTVTLGIVSAKARSIGAGPYDDFIQTDASINPGNSGGPLFNWRGEVVGINTAIRAGANGIGFATPVDALKDVLTQLREKGHVERGRLGILFQPLTPALANALGLSSSRGALVSEVQPGGPAARAGIKEGDVVTSVNGAQIAHAEDLPRNVARNAPGSSIKVGVVRGGKQVEVTAKLDALEDDDASPKRPTGPKRGKAQSAEKLGLQVSDAPEGGVRVDRVGGDSQELEPGDTIIEVNGAPVKSVQDLKGVTSKLKPGTTALVKVRRGKLTRFAAIPIPK
jgi:serine protease Do